MPAVQIKTDSATLKRLLPRVNGKITPTTRMGTSYQFRQHHAVEESARRPAPTDVRLDRPRRRPGTTDALPLPRRPPISNGTARSQRRNLHDSGSHRLTTEGASDILTNSADLNACCTGDGLDHQGLQIGSQAPPSHDEQERNYGVSRYRPSQRGPPPPCPASSHSICTATAGASPKTATRSPRAQTGPSPPSPRRRYSPSTSSGGERDEATSTPSSSLQGAEANTTSDHRPTTWYGTRPDARRPPRRE